MKLLQLPSFGLLSLYAAFGCSPPADPIAKGGSHYQVAFATDPGVPDDAPTCGLTSVGGIGDPPPDLPVANMPPDAWGSEVADGQSITGTDGRYEIECTVSKGDTKTISVNMAGPNTAPAASSNNKGETRLFVNGTIKADGTGEGNITVRTVVSGNMVSTMPCTLLAAPAEEGDGFAVSADALQFSFQCTQANSSNDSPGSICETRGSVTVRDCMEE